MLTLTMLRQELQAAIRYVNRAIWDSNLPEPVILHTLSEGEPQRFERRARPTFLFSGVDATREQGLSGSEFAKLLVEFKVSMTGVSEELDRVESTLKSFKELRVLSWF